MVYLVTAARADFSAQHIQWTPLAHHCGCVVAWGWRTDADSPFDFIMWCCRIIGEPCPWHCLNLVDSVKVLQQSTVMAGSADGVCTWLAAQARNVDAELGRTLSAQLQSLLTKITSVPDIAELAHEIPEKDRKRAADNGYDPIDDWIEHQLIDIILNHGFSVRAYIEQVAKARQRSAVHHTTVATEPSRPETSPHAQGCRTSGKRGARANPSRPKTRPRIPVAEMRKLCERSAGRCAFTNCNLELSEASPVSCTPGYV